MCRRSLFPSPVAGEDSGMGKSKPQRAHLFALAAFGLLGLQVACKPASGPGPAQASASITEPAEAATEPVAAVEKLGRFLQRGDLAGFARVAVPPADHARLETAWRNGDSRWPLTELPLDDQLLPLLQTLSAPGAEASLKRGFDRQLANQHRDLHAAARSLGLFGTRYVQEQGDYTPAQRRHYTQLIAALGAWGQKAPLGDPKRAHDAIDRLCAVARKTGIASEEDLRAAGMDGSLKKLAPFFIELRAVLADYGLDLDASLAQLHAETEKQDGDAATVRVRYPLAGKDIQATAELQRRDGRWYLTEYLHAAEALAAPSATSATPE